MFSASDDTVLDRVFDPEAAPSPGLIIFTEVASDPNISNPFLLTRLNAETSTIIRLVETIIMTNAATTHQALPSTSRSAFTLDHVISAFTTLVSGYPTYASAFLNRAQVLCMKYGDHLYWNPCADNMLMDLHHAIMLTTPASPMMSVSPAQAKTLASAHTLRGMLLHIASKDYLLKTDITSGKHVIDGSDVADTKTELPSLLRNRIVEEVQEMASRDSSLCGRYGNQIAKAMAVETNPYAKLCGAIVQEAMRRNWVAFE